MKEKIEYIGHQENNGTLYQNSPPNHQTTQRVQAPNDLPLSSINKIYLIPQPHYQAKL